MFELSFWNCLAQLLSSSSFFRINRTLHSGKSSSPISTISSILKVSCSSKFKACFAFSTMISKVSFSIISAFTSKHNLFLKNWSLSSAKATLFSARFFDLHWTWSQHIPLGGASTGNSCNDLSSLTFSSKVSIWNISAFTSNSTLFPRKWSLSSGNATFISARFLDLHWTWLRCIPLGGASTGNSCNDSSSLIFSSWMAPYRSVCFCSWQDLEVPWLHNSLSPSFLVGLTPLQNSAPLKYWKAFEGFPNFSFFHNCKNSSMCNIIATTLKK